MNNRLLIIGLIWPEPATTAAGNRMMQLIKFFLAQNYDITFASASVQSDLSLDLSTLGVACLEIKLNCSSFDKAVESLDPGIVMFDRFLSEEQFGWRVHEVCPKALRILDTEDLHFLRKSRETAIKNGVDQWMDFIQNDLSKREIASIYRCDLSLIISKFEYRLLQDEFNIDTALLHYLPFMVELSGYEKLAPSSFEQRQHFMTIGNFRHAPNLDGVKHLHSNIWPLIRKALPQAELHVYGAYAPQAIKQLHKPAKGFFIKGWAADKQDAFIKARICLAPLRFGAGQKGKLLDAMYYGTPSITSSIGAEGMSSSKKWNGYIEDKAESFAEKAIVLYKNKSLWQRAQQKGYELLNKNFNKNSYENLFADRLQSLNENLMEHRRSNFIGSMLLHHQHQGTKYLSKYIELKNLMNDNIVE